MNIQDAKQEIINTVRAYLKKDEYGNYKMPVNVQRPLFLMGAAGIGKTAVMQQAADECGINLVAYTITHHTRQSAVGLPFIKEKIYNGDTYSTTEYTMSEIIASVYDKIEETGITEGILFIDEINCVSETLAPTMLQFLQCKTFGTHKVPDGFIIAAAGNPPEYNKAVREFDIATLDRIRRIDVEPSFDVWIDYASDKGIHSAVISYLSVRQADFYVMEKTGNGLEFTTPRSWTELSYLLKSYEELNIPVTAQITKEYIKHNDVNERFYTFYALYSKYRQEYDVSKIISGEVTKSEKLCTAPFDEKLIIINMTADILQERFVKYVYEDDFTDVLFGFLKSLKDRADEDIIKTIEDKIFELKREINGSKKNAFVNKLSLVNKNRLLGELEIYLKIIKASNTSDFSACFSQIRKGFDSRIEKRTRFIEKTISEINNAYSFLENTFESLQEIVILTTKLTASKFAFRFLSENKCEKYYRYNKELLFDNRQKSIVSEIDKYREELKKY